MLDPAGLVNPAEMTTEQIAAENASRREFNTQMGGVDPVALIPEERPLAYPDPLTIPYRRLQEFIKHADSLTEADAMVRRFTRGTTSARKDYQVMFVGEHVMLVKWKGGTSQGYHVSGDVKVAARKGSSRYGGGVLAVGFDARETGRIWSLDTESGKPNSGRLQGQTLRDLMAKVIDLDQNYEARRKVVTDEKRAEHEREQAEAEAARQFAQAAQDERAALLARVRAALTHEAIVEQFTPEEIARVEVSLG